MPFLFFQAMHCQLDVMPVSGSDWSTEALACLAPLVAPGDITQKYTCTALDKKGSTYTVQLVKCDGKELFVLEDFVRMKSHYVEHSTICEISEHIRTAYSILLKSPCVREVLYIVYRC